MSKRQIEDIVTSMVEKIIAGTDYELVAVEYTRERDWFLRIFLDKPDGITIDDCSEISKKLNPLLDENLKIDTQYYLEVSSPGLDRPLKTNRDFLRNTGKKIDVVFYAPYNGQKNHTVSLVAADDNFLTVIGANGVQEKLEIVKIASVKLHIEF